MQNNNLLEKKNTMIFIFIQKITPKNMQDLIFFLQKNDFQIKRITKKNKKQGLTSSFVNANFLLESTQNLRSPQLHTLISFLHQHAQIHGIFSKNQVLNLKRSTQLESASFLHFWKKINNFNL